MSEIVTHDLNTLVRQAETSQTLPSSRAIYRLDVAEHERKVTYFKIMELMNAWARVYSDHIQKAIWKPGNSGPAEAELEEFIQLFDGAMTDLGLVISEHQKVIKRLEKLRDVIYAHPSTLLHELQRRRAKIRKRAAQVVLSMKAMQEKAANPAWFMRTWQKLWGQVAFVIDGEDEERFKLFATHAVGGLSRAAATKLKMDPKVVAAFDTMQLPIWAVEPEMLRRYELLIKIYHPDNRSTGNEEMCKKINAARDALLAYYAPSKGA